MHHNQHCVELPLPNEAATQALGTKLAKLLYPAMRVYLRGQLGAGKTTLVRAILLAMGHVGRVKSPSYTLVEPYTISRLYLYHFDFYRFQDPNEWVDSGFRELFASQAICLVEWPEKAEGLLPPPDIEISLSVIDQGRIATIVAQSESGKPCVSALRLPEKFS
ncbi:MAG: tRNA (adenosine(37)-N6)-threonylcarbamoyltransferase complex ATPase subunit type 1 TsaE [Burkholderiales bacterium]